MTYTHSYLVSLLFAVMHAWAIPTQFFHFQCFFYLYINILETSRSRSIIYLNTIISYLLSLSSMMTKNVGYSGSILKTGAVALFEIAIVNWIASVVSGSLSGRISKSIGISSKFRRKSLTDDCRPGGTSRSLLEAAFSVATSKFEPVGTFYTTLKTT